MRSAVLSPSGFEPLSFELDTGDLPSFSDPPLATAAGRNSSGLVAVVLLSRRIADDFQRLFHELAEGD